MSFLTLNLSKSTYCFRCSVFDACFYITGMYIMDDDKDGSELSEEQPLYIRSKLLKDRSPFTILASSRFVRNRFLISISGKKPRSTSDPKGSSSGSSNSHKVFVEPKTGGLRRNRTVTEPSVYSPGQGDVFSPEFSDLPKSPSVTLEQQDGIGETESRLPRVTERNMVVGDMQREQTSRERLAGDGPTSGGGTQFKSRSQSFNTDTTTSGISSMSSSPSRETAAGATDSSTIDTDCVSLSTVVSAQTIRTLHSLTPQSNHLPLSKSNSVLLVPPGSSHTLPRRAQSLKSPSVTTITSLTDCSFMYTSPRDALGYATLKRLQQQRIHPSLSHSEALASPAKDVLFTDTITMKAGSLDSRLTPRRSECPCTFFFLSFFFPLYKPFILEVFPRFSTYPKIWNFCINTFNWIKKKKFKRSVGHYIYTQSTLILFLKHTSRIFKVSVHHQGLLLCCISDSVSCTSSEAQYTRHTPQRGFCNSFLLLKTRVYISVVTI